MRPASNVARRTACPEVSSGAMARRESSVVTRFIETARRRPVLGPEHREVTQRVQLALSRRPSGLRLATALVALTAVFALGMVAGDRRHTHAIAPLRVPMTLPAAPAVQVSPAPRAPAAPSAAAAAAPPPAIDPSVAAETGFDLRVAPEGTQVVLDGRVIGKAPMRVRNLQPGRHRVALSAPGHRPRELAIDVEAGEAALYDLVLERSVAAPQPPKRAERAPPTEAPAAAPSTLLVNSKPPCEVWVDGRRLGTTPERLEVRAGRHEVILVNKTYEIRHRVAVTTTAGDKTRVIRDFTDEIPGDLKNPFEAR